jgi:hypothetical protein
MKVLIISPQIADKLRNTKFDGFNEINPTKGVIDGIDIEWLPTEIKSEPVFESVFKDLNTCEVRDIKTIEDKFFDETGTEIVPTKETIQITELIDKIEVTKDIEVTKFYDSKGLEREVFSLDYKRVLVEFTLIEQLGIGIVNGATAVWEGIVYVWNNTIGWLISKL